MSGVNVVSLIDGEDKYFFLYRFGEEALVWRALARYAMDEELGFTWRNAMKLSGQMMRLRSKGAEADDVYLQDSEWSEGDFDDVERC